MSNVMAIYIIWYRDILRFWRDRARLFTSFIQPFLFLVIFGTGLSASMRFAAPDTGFDAIQFMFPGIIAMVVLFTAIMSGVSIVWDREFGFLKEVLVAPVSRSAVASGKVLGGGTIAVIQGLLMLVFIPFAHVSLSVSSVFLLIALMLVTAFSLTAMGILIASRIRTMESFQVVMQLLLFPMLFISPAFFPVQSMPAWLKTAVLFNPISYAIDAMRQAVLGAEYTASLGLEIAGHQLSIALDVLLVALFGVLMVVLAVRSFSSQE